MSTLLVAVVAYAAVRTLTPDNEARHRADRADRDVVGVLPTGFDVAGTAAVPLRPGTSSPVDVTITSTHDALRVSRLVVSVRGVDAPRATSERPCTVDDFEIRQLRGSIDVDRRGAVSLSDLGWSEDRWPQLSMLDTSSNQDGCVDATVRLDYHAVGRVRS